ncbi:MAG: NosD domain-containing protein [Candidatus Micrarchaeota archaeon]
MAAKPRGQVAVEHLFLVGGAMLFVVLIIMITRTNLFGEAESGINRTGGGIIDILASIPPAPNGTAVPSLPPVSPPAYYASAACPGDTLSAGDWLFEGSIIQDNGISEPCIKITEDNVHIDCQGHAVTAGDSGTVGIRVEADGAAVTGCTISNFPKGIELAKDYAQISYNLVQGGDYGVFLASGSTQQNSITRNVIYASQYGVYLDLGDVKDNVISYNAITATTCDIRNCGDADCAETSCDSHASCTGNAFINGTEAYKCTH